MNSPERVFARYLRQRQEFGESVLVLESARREQLLTLGATGAAATERPVPDLVESTTREAAADRPRETMLAPAPGLATKTPGVNLPLLTLGEAVATCTACGLAATRSTVVFGEGDPNAELVVVGEAPGAEEDRTGRPFVGRAGKLLDTLLLSIGFPRENVYICNVLKCRPPSNRNPLPDEVEACSGFLRGQLAAIRPRAILAVGTFPAQTLLQTTDTIGRLRGKVHTFEGTPFVPTYHPAALLRNPSWIRPVWEDLQRLRRLLDD